MSQGEALVNSGELRVILDKAALLDRVGDDPAFLREVTRVYLDGRPKLLCHLRAALAEGDAAALARAAHALKGCLANLGGQAACQAALRLEHLARQGDLNLAGNACAALESEIERFERALLNLARELHKA